MSVALPILEFVCNLRWVLSYVVQRLDPVLEAHYELTTQRARRMESVLSRSYATVTSITEVPNEVLALAQQGVVYLLVAEGVLGHCPPTMHSFLLRLTMLDGLNGMHDHDSSNSNCSSVSRLCAEVSMYQAHFLCIRWLVAEGLVTDEELLDALGQSAEVSIHGHQNRFDLHVSIAKELSDLSSSSLGLHIIVTRSLILHHCYMLLSVHDVLKHVRCIKPLDPIELQNMEEALLFWLRFLLKAMHEDSTIDDRLYNAAKRELGDSLYHSTRSGVLLALSVHFYKPLFLSLSSIAVDCDGEHEASLRQKHLRNWGSVLCVSEEVGICPGLYADEVEQYGTVMLQLHVLRFVGELFAVLATQAEDTIESHENNERLSQQFVAASFHSNRESYAERRAESIARLEQQGVVESPREGNRNMTGSNGNKYEHNMSSNDNASETSDSPSLLEEFPSTFSRRQYDVMMASLKLRGGAGSVMLTRPINDSQGSWVAVSPAKVEKKESNQEGGGIKKGMLSSKVTGSLQSKAPSQAVAVGSTSLSKMQLARSHSLHVVDVRGDCRVIGKPEIAADQGVLPSPSGAGDSGTFLAMVSTSFASSPLLPHNAALSSYAEMANDMNMGDKKNKNSEVKGDSVVLPEKSLCGSGGQWTWEERSNTLSPLTQALLDPSHSVGVKTSCTTTESHFSVKLLHNRGTVHVGCSGGDNRDNDENGDNNAMGFSLASSRNQSPVQTLKMADRQGTSFIMSDYTMDLNMQLLQTSLAAHEKKENNSDHSLGPSNPCGWLQKSGSFEVQESGVGKTYSLDLSATDVVAPVADAVCESGNCNKARMTARSSDQQQESLQHPENESSKVESVDLRLNGDFESSVGEVISSFNKTLKSTELRLKISCAVRRSESSEQCADTEVSTLPDSFLDWEGSFFDDQGTRIIPCYRGK